MARNDKLYEESRIIRKAVNEGKTTTEIMQMLSLSANQIRYRVETRYSEGVAKKIIQLLNKNDGKVTEKAKKKWNNKRSLVVDTSSLGRKGAFDFIMSHSSVILLLDVVKELEKFKVSKGILGMNVRHLLAESARDKEGKKIKVEIAENISNYTDENLLNFCKGKDVILYTADNAMATMARAYGIEYIIAENVLAEQEETETKETETKETETEETETEETETKETETEEVETQLDIASLLQNMRSNSIIDQEMKVGDTTISNVSILGKKLILTIPETYKIRYIVLSEEKVKHPTVGNSIYLERGNIVLIMTYKLKHNGLCVARYEITKIQSENHAIYLGDNKISNSNQIEALDLPKEAKREVRNYFSLVRKNN